MLWLLNLDFAASEQAPVEVPDVVGETQANGTTTLEGEGFVVAVATAYSNVVPAGTIISQDPAGGEFAAVGSTVTITVSLGEQPVSTGTGDDTPWDPRLLRMAQRARKPKVIEEAVPTISPEIAKETTPTPAPKQAVPPPIPKRVKAITGSVRDELLTEAIAFELQRQEKEFLEAAAKLFFD